MKFMEARNMHVFCEFGGEKGTTGTLGSKRMSVPNINQYFHAQRGNKP